MQDINAPATAGRAMPAEAPISAHQPQACHKALRPIARRGGLDPEADHIARLMAPVTASPGQRQDQQTAGERPVAALEP